MRKIILISLLVFCLLGCTDVSKTASACPTTEDTEGSTTAASDIVVSLDSINTSMLDPKLAVANGEYVIVMECYDYTSYTSPMRAIPNRIIYMPHLVKDAELAKAAPTQTDKDINELYEAMRVQFISAVNANTDFIREYCTSDQRKAHYANLSKWGLFNYGTEI